MIKTKQLTRICTACGMEKPLSAFLQMGPQGTSYGDICITCRNQQTKKNTSDEEIQEDDSSTLPPKNRIGIKEKVFINKEQNRQIKDIKELLKQELKRKEELSQAKTEKKDIENKAHKKHHQAYLDKKIKENEEPHKRFAIENGQPKDKTITSFLQTQKILEKERTLTEKKIQDEVIEKEIREAATDFNNLNHSYISASKLEFQSAAFFRFQELLNRRLLGPAGKELNTKKTPPIVRVMQKFYGDQTGNSQEQKNSKRNDSATTDKKSMGKEIAQSILNKGPKRGR